MPFVNLPIPTLPPELALSAVFHYFSEVILKVLWVHPFRLAIWGRPVGLGVESNSHGLDVKRKVADPLQALSSSDRQSTTTAPINVSGGGSGGRRNIVRKQHAGPPSSRV